MNRTARRERSDATTVVLHWLLVFTLGLSLATGLRIAVGTSESAWMRWLEPVLPQGQVINLHVIGAFGLISLAVAYMVFLRRARLTARVAVEIGALRSASREVRWRSINRAIYWIAFLLVAAATASGALLYFSAGLVRRSVVEQIHIAVAWSFVGYLVLHVAAQFAFGGWRQLQKIVTPRAAYGGAAIVSLVCSSVAFAALFFPVDAALIGSLRLARTATPPVLDGDPGDDAWKLAVPAEIHTAEGEHLPGGEVRVRVRGLYDDVNAYLLFEWPDETRSQKHMPLVKTALGWRLLESRYAANDENDYFEDQFSVMLTREAKVRGPAIHLGPKPLADKPPSASGRGLHYTTDGSIADIWHWKSVSTGPLQQLEDDYFGPPAQPNPGETYSGGYGRDPSSGGGSQANWTEIEGRPGFVLPRYLPKDLAALQATMGSLDVEPNVGEDGQMWMALADSIAYRPELDTYPAGTVIPSVLIDRPFEGDRGDVAAVATWKDGWWRLETKRRLDTGSRFDVPIATGTHLSVAVFDHSQSRHSRHLHPLRIEMEK